MSKPLKTVEDLLMEVLLVWKQDYPKRDGDSGLLMDEYFQRLEDTKSEAITQLNNHYKELFLSIIGEDLVNINGSPAKTWMNRYKAELREELAKELEASTKGGER